jgi:hypothetical protein
MPYVTFLVLCRIDGAVWPLPLSVAAKKRRASKMIADHLRNLGVMNEKDQDLAFGDAPEEVQKRLTKLIRYEHFCRRAVRVAARDIIRAAKGEERKQIVEQFLKVRNRVRELRKEPHRLKGKPRKTWSITKVAG